MSKRTILLYGRTSSGKTTQLGLLAEDIFKTEGKKTRLYTGDRGGLGTIQPYIDLGIIEVVEMAESDPWIFLNKATRGHVRDSNGVTWVLNPERNAEIGIWAFESLRSFAEALMADMTRKVGQGVSIGGSANIDFTVTDGMNKLKVSGANIAMFGVAQARMTDEVWESQRLPGYVVWTSSVSKDEDTTSSGKVLGPDVIGKALTAEVPRWFNLTFRIDVLPAQGGKPERHILYLGNHIDVGAGNAAGLGNTRLPLDAPPPTKLTIEPANIVEALKVLDSGYDVAKETIRKRLELK